MVFSRYTLRRAVDWILHLKPEKVGKEKVGWTRTWENLLQETPPLSSRAVRICWLRWLLLSSQLFWIKQTLRTGGGAHVTPKRLSHGQSHCDEVVCLHGIHTMESDELYSLDSILCLYFHNKCENEEGPQHDYLSQMWSAFLRLKFRTYHSLVFIGKKTVHKSSDNVFYHKIRRAQWLEPPQVLWTKKRKVKKRKVEKEGNIERYTDRRWQQWYTCKCQHAEWRRQNE